MVFFFFEYLLLESFPLLGVTVHLLPSMSSNTALVSGPAVGAAQTLILSYSFVFLLPMSTANIVFFCGSSQCPFIYSIDTESP